MNNKKTKTVKRCDFSPQTKKSVRKQSGYICSNPSCRKFLWSPNKNNNSASGVVSHIIAASKNGPRASPDHNQKNIKSYKNALLLCSNCDKMIDAHPSLYPIDMLTEWKNKAEKDHMRFLDSIYSFSSSQRKLKESEKKLSDVQQENHIKLCNQEEQVKSLQKELTAAQNLIDVQKEYIQNIIMHFKNNNEK